MMKERNKNKEGNAIFLNICDFSSAARAGLYRATKERRQRTRRHLKLSLPRVHEKKKDKESIVYWDSISWQHHKMLINCTHKTAGREKRS